MDRPFEYWILSHFIQRVPNIGFGDEDDDQQMVWMLQENNWKDQRRKDVTQTNNAWNNT